MGASPRTFVRLEMKGDASFEIVFDQVRPRTAIGVFFQAFSNTRLGTRSS